MNYLFVWSILVLIILCLWMGIHQKIFLFVLYHDPWFPSPNKCDMVNQTYRSNRFYQEKYRSFFDKYGWCKEKNFSALPYLTKDDLIEYNDDILYPSYKKCYLQCLEKNSNCMLDPLWFDFTCSVGQSTGGTSGKSTFVWMSLYDAYLYSYTFMASFKKNGYCYGDKIMVFYPADSYFTNEYEKTNHYFTMLANFYFLSFRQIDKETTIRFVDSINTNCPELLVIFPFVLLQLCVNIQRYGLKLTHLPRNINVSGEFLLNCSLRFCQQTFVTSTIENTYGAVEFGEIAHQLPGDKNTLEVFDSFCYVENWENRIVVTSFMNHTFPMIRYVMEDIGEVVNKDGKQYIRHLVGKNTNQIVVNGRVFRSLDVDTLIDQVNISDNIISIVMEYDHSSIDIHYIVYQSYNEEEEQSIIRDTYSFMGHYFERLKYNIDFLETYRHDYLKKFKIIVNKDNSDSEPVGGYFKHESMQW